MPVRKTDEQKQTDFNCSICDYSTCHRGHWKMHIDTVKHKMLTSIQFNKNLSAKLTTPYSQCVCPCGKSYSSKPSLSRHKKTCKTLKEWEETILSNQEIENILNEEKEEYNNTVIQITEGQTEPRIVMDRKTYELMEENSKLKDTMISALKNKPIILSTGDNAVINTNHNTLNVNVYLDQNYAQAMNLHDFVRNIKCSLDDLTLTADEGYVKGVSHIFLRSLDNMDPKERPIHCGDQHGTQIYIRESNKWEKDGGKLDYEIDNVAKKQIMLMSEWEKKYPSWHKDEKLTHEYLKLVRQLTTHDKENGNEQIKKVVAKNVVLNEIIHNK